MNAHNSYPGNLPRDLEAEKLRLLTEKITRSFGTRPVTYLAGRYGFGPNTGEILEGGATEAPASAQVSAIHDTFLVATLLIAVALALASWSLVRERRERRVEAAATQPVSSD